MTPKQRVQVEDSLRPLTSAEAKFCRPIVAFALTSDTPKFTKQLENQGPRSVALGYAGLYLGLCAIAFALLGAALGIFMSSTALSTVLSVACYSISFGFLVAGGWRVTQGSKERREHRLPR